VRGPLLPQPHKAEAATDRSIPEPFCVVFLENPQCPQVSLARTIRETCPLLCDVGHGTVFPGKRGMNVMALDAAQKAIQRVRRGREWRYGIAPSFMPKLAH
jgi:hypothetical protein